MPFAINAIAGARHKADVANSMVKVESCFRKPANVGACPEFLGKHLAVNKGRDLV